MIRKSVLILVGALVLLGGRAPDAQSPALADVADRSGSTSAPDATMAVPGMERPPLALPQADYMGPMRGVAAEPEDPGMEALDGLLLVTMLAAAGLAVALVVVTVNRRRQGR